MSWYCYGDLLESPEEEKGYGWSAFATTLVGFIRDGVREFGVEVVEAFVGGSYTTGGSRIIFLFFF